MPNKDQKEKTTLEQAEKLVREAVLETPGVASIQPTPPIMDGIFMSNLFGNLEIDIFVNVFYGSNIPEVSWNIQESVKEKLETETTLSPKHINIHIEGVDLSNV